MSLQSEQNLSLEELKRLNQPPSVIPSLPVESIPTRQEWEYLLSLIKQTSSNLSAQTSFLRGIYQRPTPYPTAERIAALAQDVAEVRALLEQVGKKKERRFAIRLPRLHLPQPSVGMAVSVILFFTFLLALYKLAVLLNGLEIIHLW